LLFTLENFLRNNSLSDSQKIADSVIKSGFRRLKKISSK
jgi:hypothetical protein